MNKLFGLFLVALSCFAPALHRRPLAFGLVAPATSTTPAAHIRWPTTPARTFPAVRSLRMRSPWRPARKDPTRLRVIKDRRTPWIGDLEASASFAFRANNGDIMRAVQETATAWLLMLRRSLGQRRLLRVPNESGHAGVMPRGLQLN